MNSSFRFVTKKITVGGWVLIRIVGSHYTYKKPGVDGLVVIPRHSKKDLSPAVIRSVEKKTGITLR